MRNEKMSLDQRVSDLDAGAQSFKDEIRQLEAEIKKFKLRERDNEEVFICGVALKLIFWLFERLWAAF